MGFTSDRTKVCQEADSSENYYLRRRLDALLKVCEIAAPANNLDELCVNATTALAYEFGADNASIFLCTPDGREIVERAWFRAKPLEEKNRLMSFPSGVGRMAELNLVRKPIEVDMWNPNPIDADPEFVKNEYAYYISVPLFSRTDLVGVFSLIYKVHRSWTDDERDLLVAIGGLLGTLIRQTRVVESVRSAKLSADYQRFTEAVNERLAWIVEHMTQDDESTARPQAVPNVFIGEVKEQAHLSDREGVVLSLLAQGKSNEEIASALSVSEITVKKQISNILSKLGARNRVQAAVFAVRAGYAE